MMRVFWDEWRGAVAASRNAVPFVALIVLAGLFLVGFQFGVLPELAAAAAVVAGYWSGTQRWNQAATWDWRDEGVGAVAFVLGKVAGFLAFMAWSLVFLLPVGVLLVVSWGTPAAPVVEAAAWVVVAGLLAQALALAAAWTSGFLTRTGAGFAVGAWLTAGLFWPASLEINPFWQIHLVQQNPDHHGALGVAILLLAALWLFVGVRQARTR